MRNISKLPPLTEKELATLARLYAEAPPIIPDCALLESIGLWDCVNCCQCRVCHRYQPLGPKNQSAYFIKLFTEGVISQFPAHSHEYWEKIKQYRDYQMRIEDAGHDPCLIICHAASKAPLDMFVVAQRLVLHLEKATAGK
jgi:hypothetical protein